MNILENIRSLAVLFRPIRSDEEIPKCAEIRKWKPKSPRNNVGFGENSGGLIAATSASPKAVVKATKLYWSC